MDPQRVVVGSRRLARVELFDLHVALAHDVVVADDDAGDRGQEDGVGGEVRREGVGRLEQVPRTHGQPDCGADVAAAADVQEARQQRRHVRAGGDGVGGDVGAELGEGEGRGDDEDAEALAGAALDQEALEQVERVPDRVTAEDDGRRRRHDDADEGCYGEADRNREELRPQRVAGLLGETGEIGVVDDESGEVGDGAHDAFHHLPAELASVRGAWLMDDGPNAFGAHDGPDEECNAGSGDEEGLDCEKMPDFVDGEPNGG